MSKGSVIIHVRFPSTELFELQTAYQKWEENGQQVNRSMSDFIRSAVAEKIAHGRRSRRTKVKTDQELKRTLETLAREQIGVNLRLAGEEDPATIARTDDRDAIQGAKGQGGPSSARAAENGQRARVTMYAADADGDGLANSFEPTEEESLHGWWSSPGS